jgi:hypothetical protein
MNPTRRNLLKLLAAVPVLGPSVVKLFPAEAGAAAVVAAPTANILELLPRGTRPLGYTLYTARPNGWIGVSMVFNPVGLTNSQLIEVEGRVANGASVEWMCMPEPSAVIFPDNVSLSFTGIKVADSPTVAGLTDAI